MLRVSINYPYTYIPWTCTFLSVNPSLFFFSFLKLYLMSQKCVQWVFLAKGDNICTSVVCATEWPCFLQKHRGKEEKVSPNFMCPIFLTGEWIWDNSWAEIFAKTWQRCLIILALLYTHFWWQETSAVLDYTHLHKVTFKTPLNELLDCILDDCKLLSLNRLTMGFL